MDVGTDHCVCSHSSHYFDITVQGHIVLRCYDCATILHEYEEFVLCSDCGQAVALKHFSLCCACALEANKISTAQLFAQLHELLGPLPLPPSPLLLARLERPDLIEALPALFGGWQPPPVGYVLV